MAISTAVTPSSAVESIQQATHNNTSTEQTKIGEHLLENKWVLWYRPPANHTSSTPKAAQWEDSQKRLFGADTVENFWRGFHAVPRITNGHPVNCDYSLFKEGIKPMWEDEFNKAGGRWTLSMDKQSSMRSPHGTPMPSVIEQVWLDVMLCLIGEGFDPHGDKIAGGVCGIRGGKAGGNSRSNTESMIAKIHIWTKDAADSETNLKIGEILKKVVQASEGQLQYSPHDNGNKGRGSNGRTLRL